MNTPKMILFDYGQTLVNERRFDGIAGTEAILKHAIENKYNRTAAEVQAVADAINDELGRFDPARKHLFPTEVPNYMFRAYLYESQGIKLNLSPLEADRIFWDAAALAVPTDGIKDFLDYLWEKGIRTGVISNISYCGEAVTERINTLLPDNHFEFIIATSEYMFRKPNKRIFELALEKADLKPEEVWYVGDQIKADVEGAKGAGLFPIWYTGALDFDQGATEAEALMVRSWKVLMEIIK